MHKPVRLLVIYVIPLTPAVVAVWALLTHRSVVVALALLVVSAALSVSAFFRSRRLRSREAARERAARDE